MYSSLYSSRAVDTAVGAGIWLIVALVLAIVGGILIYFLFLSKKNEGRFQGFLGWLYDFLSFKKFFLEAVLKITYLVVAIYITLASFAMIASNFLGFILTLVLGNIFARILYEFSLLILVICRNTTEINAKLSGKNNNNNNDNIEQ